MTKKKTLKASAKKLERTVRKLEADVESTKAKAARWKNRAKQNETAAEASQAQVAKLEKKLAKSRRAARPSPDSSAEVSAVDKVSPAGAGQESLSPDVGAPAANATPAPDDSWTVTALRAEARSRGVVGYSRKSKADLLAALR